MSDPLSIREQIETIAVAMRSDPPPSEIRGYEVALAGLLWRVNKEVTTADVAFRRAVFAAEGPSAAAKRQVAEASDFYARLLEAQTTAKSCLEMLRTCRSALKSVSDEMRLAK